MSSLKFDSLRFARKLKEVGVPENQAEMQAELMAETFGFYIDDLVTKDHLDLRFAEHDAIMERRFAQQEAIIEQRFLQQDAMIEQRFTQQEGTMDRRFAAQDHLIERRISHLDVKLNVMAALLAIIAASVLPIGMSVLFSG